ncbi:RsmD family RNA methyltransferase, partial [Candidatus Saccharibacteria bacterium]|nr:RsmD family RNA methyltransferase [Candidatus Saccharibacteria bacterium]
MRIISGQLKGRNFASPRGHKTHPMSDKMRGALFNILGDIEGLSFLDAFSGSGA